MAVAVRPPDGPAEPRQYLAGAHEGAENRQRQNPRLGPVRAVHLGRNGAVHGGALGLLFDSVLGYTAARLTRSPYQRTAFLHINYRRIAPIETELQIDAGIERVEGRKIFVEGRLLDGDTLLTDAEALFVRLRPGQP